MRLGKLLKVWNNEGIMRQLLSIIVLSFGLVLTSVLGVHAQDAAGLTIIPPRFEIFANPGETETQLIRVRNDSPQPLNLSVLVEDFSSAGEEGGVVLEEGESDTAYSLRRWIELSSENIVLQPGEEQAYPFTIRVPRDADPGGHYASILFQIGSGEAEPGVASVQHRVGSLVLLRVSGDVVEDAEIASFSVPKYSRTTPVTFDLRVQNNGTTHIQPEGTIVITNMFRQKVDEIPLNSANVFPGAIRRMQTEWNPTGPVFGIYTATLVSTYGQQNLVLTAASRFAVASPLALAILVVGGSAAIIFVVSLVAGRKRVAKALKVLSSGS